MLNHLLEELDRPRVAVIENEVGEVSIDHHLVLHTDLGSLQNIQGRTCCTAREEFIRLLRIIACNRCRYDRVLVETTGVAHPGMVAHAIWSDPMLKEHLRLDGVVVVVDAGHILDHLGGEGHASEQIAYADLLVVNKVDTVSAEELERAIEAVTSINVEAPHVLTCAAKVDVARVLDIGGFDLRRIENGVGGCGKTGGDHGSSRHSREIGTVSIDLVGDMDVDRFQQWLEGFVTANAGDLFRSKGIVAIQGMPERVVFQGVHGMFQMALGRAWGDETHSSQAVFIGRNLDREHIVSAMVSCLVEDAAVVA